MPRLEIKAVNLRGRSMKKKASPIKSDFEAMKLSDEKWAEYKAGKKQMAKKRMGAKGAKNFSRKLEAKRKKFLGGGA